MLDPDTWSYMGEGTLLDAQSKMKTYCDMCDQIAMGDGMDGDVFRKVLRDVPHPVCPFRDANLGVTDVMAVFAAAVHRHHHSDVRHSAQKYSRRPTHIRGAR